MAGDVETENLLFLREALGLGPWCDVGETGRMLSVLGPTVDGSVFGRRAVGAESITEQGNLTALLLLLAERGLVQRCVECRPILGTLAPQRIERPAGDERLEDPLVA